MLEKMWQYIVKLKVFNPTNYNSTRTFSQIEYRHVKDRSLVVFLQKNKNNYHKIEKERS